MRMANREEIATLTFMGVTERIVIGQEDNGEWKMVYLRTNGGVAAFIDHGKSREDILRRTKECMCGHGKALIENLIQSSEIYLGSMNS